MGASQSQDHSRNNCYNYAMRKYTDTFAQPGRSNDPTATNETCSRLNQNVANDIGKNGRPIDIDKPCAKGEWKICGFRAVGDYHFYRQDSSDEWTHKQGNLIPTRIDASGQEIKDVLTADRKYGENRYEQLCGCYCVNNKVIIK